MSATLPPFPVDDDMLTQVEHALGARIAGRDENGNRILDGAEFTLSQLLNFLSGYDPTKVEYASVNEQWAAVPVMEYTGGPIYHRDDVIRALVAEVRRLREEAGR